VLIPAIIDDRKYTVIGTLLGTYGGWSQTHVTATKIPAATMDANKHFMNSYASAKRQRLPYIPKNRKTKKKIATKHIPLNTNVVE